MGKQTTNQNFIPLSHEELRHLSKDELIEWGLALQEQVAELLCWSHLKRDFEEFSERSGKGGNIGEQLLAKVELMFRWWHWVRDGTLSRETFQSYMKPLRVEVEKLLCEGTICGQEKMQGSCKRILKQASALWTFVDVEGVEPTNNTAERAVRPGVLWRKGS